MPLTARLKRTALVSLAVLVSVVTGYVIARMLALLIVFAFFPFSGHSHRGLDFFMIRVFQPGLAFFGGMLAFGGVTAIFSAIFASNRLWFKAIAIVGVFGGFLTVMNPSLQNWLAAQGAPVNKLVENLNKTNVEKEEELALDFVKQNEAVMQEVGGNGTVHLVSSTMSKDGLAIYYDIGVVGTRTIYAIVEVSKKDGTSHFTLACTTPLYTGQRDSFKHPCKQ